MTLRATCEDCRRDVEGADIGALGDAFIAHYRTEHPDKPYPDTAIRNYAEATQRLSDATERLDTIGTVEVHRVTEDRIDDWLAFFDRDAFAGNPAWAACYCSEPHLFDPKAADADHRTWQQSRSVMVDMLRSGRSFGYLAYVDGRPAGWVNASKRSEYALYRRGEGADPADGDVAGLSCFVIAPPYRRHGLAAALLERVLADAPSRGVGWVEAYPFKDAGDDAARNFRGPRSMYDATGFEPIVERERDVVVRKRIEPAEVGR
jgi:GNAT superfamily N-acetyltransferase